jgi:hypothetical protein
MITATCLFLLASAALSSARPKRVLRGDRVWNWK